MANGAKHNAFSLVELLVVLGVIAALVAIAIPSIKAMQKSFDSTGAESMISTALSTARTIAISRQRYAGVRFQKAYNGDNIIDAEQYMIFIINDEDNTTLSDRFIAVEGYKPIKLPTNSGVMDLKVGKDSDDITANSMISSNDALTDTTAFSIIFSPAGKLVVHNVQTRNKDNVTSGTGSNDMVFNTLAKITDVNQPAGLFLQDYTTRTSGLGKEPSRKKFVIYNCEKFKKTDKDKRYDDYLKSLSSKPCTLNPYTGQIVVSR